MLQKNKVSVVVPIYKVEKYINRCIESILNQTYSNIEVILVNDGSPDNCGKIAERYSQIDNRVKVIHKNNGGLSDARNFGMKHVTGEYLIFVDSDDWIEQTMIEVLVNNCIKHKADVVQSAFYYAYEDKLLLDNRFHSRKEEPIILDNRTLMYELVKNEKVKNFAWGKLYKTKMILDITFEKGVLFEDVYWAYKVMHLVNKYLIIHEPLYNYFQRNDSIVTTYTSKNLDIIKGLRERHHFIERFYKELTDESLKSILQMSLIHYNLLLINRKKDIGGLHRKEIQLYVRKNYHKLKKAVNKDKQLTHQLLLFSLHPFLNVLYLGLKKSLRACHILSRPVGLEQISVGKNH